jgi:hypothetical protein
VPTLAEQIVAVHTALTAGEIPHAFGGALALAYHTSEPRATVDIDINIWTSVARADEVVRSLPDGVAWSDDEIRAIERDGQVRLYWDRTPLDLFFPQHELHDEAAATVEQVPFGSVEIPVLSATHLAVFKALFNREKDWVDIGELLTYGEVNRERVGHWLTSIVGEEDERLVKWAERVRLTDGGATA